MVRDFQSVIGREARAQILEREGRLPDALIACVGAARIRSVYSIRSYRIQRSAMIGVEAGGSGNELGQHARFNAVAADVRACCRER